MPGIDETLHLLSAADRGADRVRHAHRGDGLVGRLLVERLTAAGHELAGRAIVTDEVEAIRGQVSAWVADPDVDIIISTGGTGFAPRDVTPEAVRPLCRREMDGFSARLPSAPATARSACRRCSRAPLPGRSTTPSSSACRARPGPAATAGTWCSARSSTAATGPARWPARFRDCGSFAHDPAQPCRRGGPRPHGRCLGQGADRIASPPPRGQLHLHGRRRSSRCAPAPRRRVR